MKSIEQFTDPDALAVIEHAMTGKPLDPEVAKRVREAGNQIRETIYRNHGLVDIAVPAIREFRGELPE